MFNTQRGSRTGHQPFQKNLTSESNFRRLSRGISRISRQSTFRGGRLQRPTRPSFWSRESGSQRQADSVQGVRRGRYAQFISNRGPPRAYLNDVVINRECNVEAAEFPIRVLFRPLSMCSTPVMIDRIVTKAGVDDGKWLRTGCLPRADYEEKCNFADLSIRLTPLDKQFEDRERHVDFLSLFCRETKYHISDAVQLELPKTMRSLFNVMKPDHTVEVQSFSLGNCPASGVFLSRASHKAKVNVKNYSNTNFDFWSIAESSSFASFAHVQHDCRSLQIFFSVSVPSTPNGLSFAVYRIVASFQAFRKAVVDTSDYDVDTIYLNLKHPPELWKANLRNVTAQGRRIFSRGINIDTCTDWRRELCWPFSLENGAGCSTEVLSQSPWLRLDIPKSQDECALEVVSRMSNRSDMKVFFSGMNTRKQPLISPPSLHSLGSFRADYAVMALIGRGSVVLDQLFEVSAEGAVPLDEENIFFKCVRYCMKVCARACEETLLQLINAIEEGRNIQILYAFHKIYTKRKGFYERILAGELVKTEGFTKPIPKNCVYVAKVMVTPTRIVPMAPDIMLSNRVVRKFGAEYALRCVFRDESGQRLKMRFFNRDESDSENPSNAMQDTIEATLKNGLYFHPRVYKFLAWSNSQLRDHGCFMFAARKDPVTGKLSGTVDEIRRWMGEFSSCKSIPKMMSRMGQCFSQAQPTFKLKREHWTVEEDIIGGDTGKYTFSDGCGRISFKLAQKMATKLDLEVVPCCYQVRFRGFKGMLAIDPLIDKTHNVPKIIFRKSQEKFDVGKENDDDYLEVVKYAMPSPACFNRPMITILDQVTKKQSSESHLRMCNRVKYYMEKELLTLRAMLFNENYAAEQLGSRLSLPIDFQSLSRSGVRLTTDPFIRQMLVSIYRYCILQNLAKAKIFLPGNLGRTLYGLVDEFGVLMPGQVFVQYSSSLRKTSLDPISVKGKVLISKNPCHVAGDVRVFDAVDAPPLRHLVDVVVFSAFGERPAPDEMAGSDLDGDEYTVIWDQDMLFDYNEPAMFYPSSASVDNEKTIFSNDEVVDFFLRYLDQDSIGRISNAHMTSADHRGLYHPISNAIALKCAVAVDFPKSGVAAALLEKEEQCDAVPDFMANFHSRVYISGRLNGELFRMSQDAEAVLEKHEARKLTSEFDYDCVLCPDDVDVFFGFTSALEEAKKIHRTYAQQIQNLMDEYGIKDEASIVSGHAAVIKRLAGMEKDDYSFYHTEKVVEMRYQSIFHAFRKLFFDKFGGEENCKDSEGNVRTCPAMFESARQWYFVAYVLPTKTTGASSLGQSLPWIVWDIIAQLRTQLMADEIGYEASRLMTPKFPLSEILAEKISESVTRKKEQYDEFRLQLSEELLKYSFSYGEQLTELVFALDEWLKEAEPRLCCLTIPLGRLLVQFALCDLHIGLSGALGIEQSAVFSKKLSRSGPAEKILDTFDGARLLFNFLQLIANKLWTSRSFVRVSLFDDDVSDELVDVSTGDWGVLNALSARTLLEIAISGRFDALHLEKTGLDLVNESRRPIIVSSSLFAPNSSALSANAIIEKLKEWTEVEEIMVRNHGFRRMLCYVSCVGTAEARQLLSRLLFHEVEFLHSLMQHGTQPLIT